LTDSLRRIVESANPIDALRHEVRAACELTRRHDLERRAIIPNENEATRSHEG
jgi:hypothetical protein